MRTTFYPKFQHGQAIKRIAINLDINTWATFSSAVMKSFNISSKKELTLTYIDSDNDEVTLNNDGDLRTSWGLICSDSPPIFFVHLSDKLAELPKKIQEPSSMKAKHRKNVHSEMINWIPSQVEELNGKLYESSFKNSSIELSKEDISELVEEIFLIPQVQQKVQEKIKQFRTKYKKEFALAPLKLKDLDFCVKAEKISSEKVAQILSSTIKQATLLKNALLVEDKLLEKQEKPKILNLLKKDQNEYIDCNYRAENYKANFVMKNENGKNRLFAVQDKEYEFIKSQIQFERSLYESKVFKSNLLINKGT